MFNLVIIALEAGQHTRIEKLQLIKSEQNLKKQGFEKYLLKMKKKIQTQNWTWITFKQTLWPEKHFK